MNFIRPVSTIIGPTRSVLTLLIGTMAYSYDGPFII